MSHFSVSIELGDTTGARFERVEAVVDTGATFAAAPRALLERLGVRPIDRQRFRLADGRVVENEVGEVLIRLEGKQRTTPVIFNRAGRARAAGRGDAGTDAAWCRSGGAAAGARGRFAG